MRPLPHPTIPTILILTTYRQSSLGIENAEFPGTFKEDSEYHLADSNIKVLNNQKKQYSNILNNLFHWKLV